jgi:hypothetical protein
MICRGSTHTTALSAAVSVVLGVAVLGTPARAQGKYPDWSGQWTGLNVGQWDPTKPAGRSQQAPLTPEYAAIFAAAQADRQAGGRGNTPSMTCIPPGMPRAMIVYEAMEIVIKPNITYLMFEFMNPLRRIYTDGRNQPATAEPTFLGYSIGHWEGADAAGKYDALAIETRNFKGPRIVDGSGIPLHDDNQTVVKERIFLDKTNAEVLHDEITLIDHAFTRPWTVTRAYKRTRDPVWTEYNCSESNEHVFIGNEGYLMSADGYLMPTRKGQRPPDPRYFIEPAK